MHIPGKPNVVADALLLALGHLPDVANTARPPPDHSSEDETRPAHHNDLIDCNSDISGLGCISHASSRLGVPKLGATGDILGGHGTI